ncbi:MAG: zinc-ribbon domain-containing protein [Myxococcales bacterium]|nr:zinc-ribbon domain-containing protein [Myxococcales bacterium]
MNYCPQCRSPLETGARFCQNCGHTLPGQAPPPAPGGPRPFAGQPGYAPPAQPGYGPPPAQPGYAPPQPGYAPPAQPGYGAPPPEPPGYGAPAPGPLPVAPPPADEGGGLKVLGGCGVAGCLGAGFAVLMGIGLIIVVVVLGGSSGGGGSSSGPSSGVPNSGSLRDIVRPQVGEYRLVGTAPLEKVPADVVDSLGALYSGPGGVLVKQYMFVYPSEPMAAERIRNVFASSVSDLKPGQRVSRGDLKNNDGAIIGTVVGLTGVDPESYYWNNRKLVVIVIAPAPHAKAFTTVSPY